MVAAAALVVALLFLAVVHAQPQERVPPSEFLCNSEGYFPDPLDCTQFHVCVHFPNAEPEFVDAYSAHCEEGLAYDARSTACRFTLTDDVCTRAPVQCLYPNQWGLVEEAPNIYWKCNNYLMPVYTDCGLGFVYNGVECVEAATTTAPPTGPKPPVNGKCVEPGVWADPANCRRYYTCTTRLKLCHQQCCLGYHFDAARGKCVRGSC